MRARRWLIVTSAVLAARSAPAFADHHAMMAAGSEGDSQFDASIALLAASFSTMFYGGDYEGVLPAAGWSRGRFAAVASMPYYRMSENGLETYGPGDLLVQGQVRLLEAGSVTGGAMFGASDPTGDTAHGMGMGHPMLMPAAWGAWQGARVLVTGSLGYSRAILDVGHHDHGMWPLVEPMNMSEITWSGSGELAISGSWHAGARLSGGVPVGSLPGHERVVGTLRVAYREDKVETAVEIQGGLVGDPFTARGILSTAIRF
jgi:hypothetical protein